MANLYRQFQLLEQPSAPLYKYPCKTVRGTVEVSTRTTFVCAFAVSEPSFAVLPEISKLNLLFFKSTIILFWINQQKLNYNQNGNHHCSSKLPPGIWSWNQQANQPGVVCILRVSLYGEWKKKSVCTKITILLLNWFEVYFGWYISSL